MDKRTADRILELVKTIGCREYELGEFAGRDGDGMAPHPNDVDDPDCDTDWPESILQVARDLKCAEVELKLLLYHVR